MSGGICFGKIVSVDATGHRPLYHVLYTDGDEEDFDRAELLCAYELFGAMAIDTYKPLSALEGEGSSEEEAGGDDDGLDDSEHEIKVKRKAMRKTGRQDKPRKQKEEGKTN